MRGFKGKTDMEIRLEQKKSGLQVESGDETRREICMFGSHHEDLSVNVFPFILK
jgi:hypothetical protein